jgi:transposase
MSAKKSYESSFKAELALKLLKEEKSIFELSTEYQVPQTNLTEWKNKLISQARTIFIPESEKNKQMKLLQQEIEKLHSIIGEITVENNFFKKKLQR